MLVQIVLLFFIALNCAAGYGGGLHHKPHEFVHQPQHWPSEYWSEKPQFHTAFGLGGLPYLPQSHWGINQGIGIRDYRNSRGYVNQHQQYLNQAHQQQYVKHPQQHVIYPQQYEHHPQQYVNHPQQYVNHPQQYVNHPQQYVNHPQQYVNHPQQYVNHPQQYVNKQQQNVNHPQQYVNRPQQYVNKQQQNVNQPQPEDSSEDFYNLQPTSPPTPLLAPTLPPPQYLLAASYSTSGSNRISEKNCYSAYVPVSGSAFVMGGDLTKIGEFPYMVAIGYRRQGGGYDYQCGGTKISSVYVLTAAHCRTSGTQVAAVVKPGGAKLDDNSIEYEPIEIMDIIVHPNYKRRQVYDDIAILRLKKAPNGNPACLWTKDEINYNTATAIGYGQTATRLTTSNDLFKVDLQLYSSQVCQAYYTPRFRIERGLIDSQICAGDFNKAKDTCPGDSGGPLLARTTVNKTEIPFILGVTSFGPGCAEGIPGVYTKVSSYLDWIESIVWPEG